MKLKGNFIYENTEELKKAIQEKSIKVEDEFITEDIDGEAIFVVANITDKVIALVRKFLLPVLQGEDGRRTRGHRTLRTV